MLVEDDEVVEHSHHWRDSRDRHFLESRHAGRTVAMGNLEDAAQRLRQYSASDQTRKQQRRCRRKPPKSPISR